MVKRFLSSKFNTKRFELLFPSLKRAERVNETTKKNMLKCKTNEIKKKRNVYIGGVSQIKCKLATTRGLSNGQSGDVKLAESSFT